jgi:hypothetical protein
MVAQARSGSGANSQATDGLPLAVGIANTSAQTAASAIPSRAPRRVSKHTCRAHGPEAVGVGTMERTSATIAKCS